MVVVATLATPWDTLLTGFCSATIPGGTVEKALHLV
jgi:hypothetical protein